MAKYYRQNTPYQDITGDEGEEPQEEKHSSGNTGLPFGLCKKYRIPLPDDATPRDAWAALEGKTGLKPDQVYEHLASGKELPQKMPTEESNLNTFVAAKTLKEAEQYARERLGINSVDYKGVDIEVANEMNEAIQVGISSCPQIKSFLKCIGSAQQINKRYREDLAQEYAKRAKKIVPWLSDEESKKQGQMAAKKIVKPVGSDVIAFARKGESSDRELNEIIKKYQGVYINEALGGSAAKLKKTLEYNYGTGFLSTKTIKGTIVHEIAHLLDFTFNLSKNARLVDLYRSASYQNISEGLSRYGASKIKEFIAEGWAEYKTSSAPREMAKSIGEIIEEAIKNDTK